jgi:hypothetical protein
MQIVRSTNHREQFPVSLREAGHDRIAAFFEELATPEGEERVRKRIAEGEKQNLRVTDWHRWYCEMYLKSPLWRKIKRRVLMRDGKRCRCCTGGAITVHHLSYDDEVLDGRDDKKLASICEGCHEYISLDESNKRRSLEEANGLLLKGRRDVSFPVPHFDLRRIRNGGAKHPPEWRRMSAVQRAGWERDLHRQKCVRIVQTRTHDRIVDVCILDLREKHGMDDAAIAALAKGIVKKTS